MAIQHVSVKNGSKGNGADHAKYIAGEGKFTEREDVKLVEDGNLPHWASSARDFFSAADEYERGSHQKKVKAKDGSEYEKTVKGRSYKEVEAAVPREAKDPMQWAKDFTKDLLGDKHPYRLAVHEKTAADGGKNTHIHLMFSTRELDGHQRDKETFFSRAKTGSYKHRKTGEMIKHDPSTGGAKKSTFWNSQKSVHFVRSSFERHVQKVSPEFKLSRSEAPEPKIGPELKRAGKDYEIDRKNRAETVTQIRDAKKQIVTIKNQEKSTRDQETTQEEKPQSSASIIKEKTEALLAQRMAEKKPDNLTQNKEPKAMENQPQQQQAQQSLQQKQEQKRAEMMQQIREQQARREAEQREKQQREAAARNLLMNQNKDNKDYER